MRESVETMQKQGPRHRKDVQPDVKAEVLQAVMDVPWLAVVAVLPLIVGAAIAFSELTR